MALSKRRLKLVLRSEAPATEIYDALTNPMKLAIWFCNKADVNLKLRGHVKMEGENCAATSFSEKVIQGTIIDLDPNRRIKYTWPINGAESEVVWEVYDKGRHCNVVLTHARVPEKSLMMDAWITYLYNLQAFLKTGRPLYRFDYKRIDKRTVKREIFIEKLPPVIWKALTEQESLRGWFAEEATVDLQIGGKYLSGWKDKQGNAAGPTEIVELAENRKLVYGWNFPGEGKSGDEVTWELTRIGEKTRVNLKHSGFDPERNNKDYAQGWHAYILKLKDFCERRGRISFQVLDGDWSV